MSSEITHTTVVVVTYNGMQWVDRCLGSLRSQPHPVHTIVIDNGSTDGTQDHVRSAFPMVELLEQQQNLGFGQANNIGLQRALALDAEHVFLLNQDAWVAPRTIGTLIDACNREPAYGVISPLHLNGHGDALDLNFSNYVVPEACPGFYSDLVLQRGGDTVYPAKFVNAAAWMMTRECIMKVGGFAPAFFHYGEDDNYVARMRFHGLLLGVLPSALVHHDRAFRPLLDAEARRAGRVRRLKLRYADPAGAADPAKERGRLVKQMLASLVTLQWKQAFVARDHLRMLKEAGLQEAVRDRELASNKGPTFL